MQPKLQHFVAFMNKALIQLNEWKTGQEGKWVNQEEKETEETDCFKLQSYITLEKLQLV